MFWGKGRGGGGGGKKEGAVHPFCSRPIIRAARMRKAPFRSLRAGTLATQAKMKVVKTVPSQSHPNVFTNQGFIK